MNEVIKMKNGIAVTDSLTIANGVDLPHKNVLELVRKHAHDLNQFGRVTFETQSFETPDVTLTCEVALLNEGQAMLLFGYFRNNPIVRAFKFCLIKAFDEILDAPTKARSLNATQLPSYPNALRQLANQIDKNNALKCRIDQDAPKVDFADSVVVSDTEMSITVAAKVLGIAPRILFDWLRLKGYLFKRANQATQDSINAGFMVVRFAAIQHADGSIEKKPFPHVTAKGLYHFYMRLGKDGLIDT